MKGKGFALLRTFVLAAFVPVLAFSLVACDPENGIGGMGGNGETPGDTTLVDNGGLPDDTTLVNNDSITDRFEPVAVDLGLSVKWASCNVGATSPEEYGSYFAWGETEEKSRYTEGTSVTWELPLSEMESRGIIGSDGNLTASYDAATANWGGDWRMPTLDEIQELVNDCTWKWATMNGVKGYKVIGSNGNSIFLPAAGLFYNNYCGYKGSQGYYWSATPDGIYSANSFHFEFGRVRVSNDGFYYGPTVRPVSDK